MLANPVPNVVYTDDTSQCSKRILRVCVLLPACCSFSFLFLFFFFFFFFFFLFFFLLLYKNEFADERVVFVAGAWVPIKRGKTKFRSCTEEKLL